jgi:hypothetical protein
LAYIQRHVSTLRTQKRIMGWKHKITGPNGPMRQNPPCTHRQYSDHQWKLHSSMGIPLANIRTGGNTNQRGRKRSFWYTTDVLPIRRSPLQLSSHCNKCDLRIRYLGRVVKFPRPLGHLPHPSLSWSPNPGDLDPETINRQGSKHGGSSEFCVGTGSEVGKQHQHCFGQSDRKLTTERQHYIASLETTSISWTGASHFQSKVPIVHKTA